MHDSFKYGEKDEDYKERIRINPFVDYFFSSNPYNIISLFQHHDEINKK